MGIGHISAAGQSHCFLLQRERRCGTVIRLEKNHRNRLSWFIQHGLLLVARIPSAEGVMYAAIRQAKAKAGMADQLASRIKEVIPIISSVQGFMGYYVIYAPDDTV